MLERAQERMQSIHNFLNPTSDRQRMNPTGDDLPIVQDNLIHIRQISGTNHGIQNDAIDEIQPDLSLQ